MSEGNEGTTTESTTSSSALEDVLWLQCRAGFGVRIQGFTVGDLLGLGAESIVDSQQSRDTKVEVTLNGRLIGWAEPAATDDHLSFRLSDLA